MPSNSSLHKLLWRVSETSFELYLPHWGSPAHVGALSFLCCMKLVCESKGHPLSSSDHPSHSWHVAPHRPPRRAIIIFVPKLLSMSVPSPRDQMSLRLSLYPSSLLQNTLPGNSLSQLSFPSWLLPTPVPIVAHLRSLSHWRRKFSLFSQVTCPRHSGGSCVENPWGQCQVPSENSVNKT